VFRVEGVGFWVERVLGSWEMLLILECVANVLLICC
jgi:hypothetical protein